MTDKIERNPAMCQSLIDTIAVNVNNERLSDSQFREFVRNSLPITVKHTKKDKLVLRQLNQQTTAVTNGWRNHNA